jgi:hypothetical protein
MLDFMVIGLPRSGTTWAANWLTTDRTLCLHDPLWTTHYSELDQAVPSRASGRLAGVSCSALWRWPDWVVRHPAKKLILHRDMAEIRRSLLAANLPALADDADELLASLPGKHAPWKDLFVADQAAQLWQWLTGGLPFDASRHAELVKLDIQPKFNAIQPDISLNRRLATELGIEPVQASGPLEICFMGKW